MNNPDTDNTGYTMHRTKVRVITSTTVVYISLIPVCFTVFIQSQLDYFACSDSDYFHVFHNDTFGILGTKSRMTRISYLANKG
jgi:hypothetical protein